MLEDNSLTADLCDQGHLELPQAGPTSILTAVYNLQRVESARIADIS